MTAQETPPGNPAYSDLADTFRYRWLGSTPSPEWMPVDARETALAQLLQGDKQYMVPLYQRTYSWTGKQLEQLWSDILEQADLLSTGDTPKGTTHFLGSVVLAPAPTNNATFQQWLVVDGQQRLTTLSLALAAIRDHVAGEDSLQNERINELYLVNRFRSGDDYLRLLPTQADRSNYSGYIRAGHAPGQADAVGDAYRFFRKKIALADDPADPHDVLNIEQAITTRLTLVMITADRGDNVHRIFESLNNTGLKLSQADLLRNYLFMRMPEHADRVYHSYWLPLQNSLSNENLEHLMWLQLVLDGDDGVRRQDIYTAQQARLEKEAAGEEAIEEYVLTLHRRAEYFRRVLDPSLEPSPAVRERLSRLAAWQATVTYPALLMMLELRALDRIDETELVRALTYIESYLVRRMICRIPTNSLNKVFQAMPSQLHFDAPFAEVVHRLLSGERRFWPTDEDLAEAIRDKPFYQFGRPAHRQFILQRLEESYNHPEPIDFAAVKLTIEHIMPQTPGTEWLQHLQAECSDGETPVDLHKRLVHTLGNLTLSGMNVQLSNHPFQRKQDLLATSHLEMNRSIADTNAWGEAEIQSRAADLAERACHVWPGPAADVPTEGRGRDWRLLHAALLALPEGRWTTYGDLAAFIGSSAVAVAQHLANTVDIPNPHRVLTSEGKVAEGFRWNGEDRGHPRDLLTVEGVEFTGDGVATTDRRVSTDELGELLGETGIG